MKSIGIRGAITVEENTAEAIERATVELFSAVLKKNGVEAQDVVFAHFTATQDLTKAHPAKFIRTNLKIDTIPMMCTQEMHVEGALEKCIRLLIVINTINSEFEAKHVYLKGARVLRPDINN